MAYRFEPAKPEEVPGVFSLFVRRVAWMKEKRIRQWDQYYLDVYPLSYYQSQQEKGATICFEREGADCRGRRAAFG